jgi:hypothetical protein
MRSYTVHSVVNELLGFLSCNACSEFAARLLVSGFADKVVHVLNDCGDAALDAVVAVRADTTHAPLAATPTNADAPALTELPIVPPATTTATTARPLKSLTVEELGRALAGLGLSTLVPVFAEKGITGILLSHCEDVSELMSEDFGVTSKVKARTLMEKLEEWRAQGVGGL